MVRRPVLSAKGSPPDTITVLGSTLKVFFTNLWREGNIWVNRSESTIFLGEEARRGKKFAGVTANVLVSAFSREIIGGSKPRNRLIFLPHYSVQFCKGNRLLAALLHFLGSRHFVQRTHQNQTHY